jgi:hypothetical protein
MATRMLSMALVAALAVQAAQPPPGTPNDLSTLVKVADKARLPWLAIDPDGNPSVAFVRNGNIELATSADGGKSFNPPVTVMDARNRDPGVANRGPRLSVDKNRRLFVTAPLCTAPSTAVVVNDLYLAVSSDKGKTFSKPYLLNEGNGTAQESVHAAAAGASDLHVAWVDVKAGKHSLLYARVDASGRKSGKPVAISDRACENCPPALALDPSGNPAVAWREGGPKPTRQIFLSRSSDGGKTFTTTQLNSIDSGLTECPGDPPALAAAPDGKLFAAAWMERRDVERDADVSWAYGPLGKFTQDTSCQDDRRFQQRRPTLAVDPDGAVWCAWEDSRLSAQRVFFVNTKADPNVPLGEAKDGPTSYPCLAAGGGKVAVAFQMGDSIGFRVLATK